MRGKALRVARPTQTRAKNSGLLASICIIMPNVAVIGRSVAEIWRFFDFSKMAAIRHHGFVIRVFGPLTKSICWHLSLCKNRLDSVK